MGPTAGMPAAAGERYARKTMPSAVRARLAEKADGKGAGAGGMDLRMQETISLAAWSFLAVAVAAVAGIVARSVLLDRWTRPQRFSLSGADLWALEQNAGRAGYFIDIGAANRGNLSNTRLLEQHGWMGTCVDPDSSPFEARECGWVTRPIGAQTGDRVDLPACRNQSCPDSKVTALGFEHLLTLLEPPPVIDYISISARSQGLAMLAGFPWDRYCARFWTLEHANEEEQTDGLWRLFGDKGCRVAIGVADFWAACNCGAAGPAAATTAAAGRPGAHAATAPAVLAAEGVAGVGGGA